jgi:GTP-binding protein
MNMADGVLLVVDSVDGPKPQTRFVLKKAIEMGLKAIVVVNKMDRQQARPEHVVDKTFDLFNELNATDHQMDFRVVYASGMQGAAGLTPDTIQPNLNVLFDEILQLPKAMVDASKPLQLLIANIDHDEFIGKLGVGRIMNGQISQNSEIAYGKPSSEFKRGKVNEIFVFNSVGREKVASAFAGDIVVVSGIPDVAIGDTIMSKDNPSPLPAISVAAPTVRMFMSVNKSPLAGRDGKHVQSRAIRDRLMKELEKNVALKVLETSAADTFELCGRGQLHLTVLIENMRREGFEMMIGPPTVIEREIDGKMCEPFDLVDISVETQFAGAVVELLKKRKGDLQSMTQSESADTQTRLVFVVPTRGMIGVRSALLTATKGNIVLDAVFDSYRPSVGPIMPRDRGSLLACEDGMANSYGINSAQERGRMFIATKEEVYKDMIVGIHSRPGDLAVNVCREKKLTNMRSAGAEGLAQLAPPMELSLDIAVEYIAEDELVEVTPHHIRMCKNPDYKKRK